MPNPVQAIAGYIESSLRCGKCGRRGRCDCWEECSCGWLAEKGKPCGNPETRFCSTKKWNSPAHIRLRKSDRVRLNPEVGWEPVDALREPGGYFGTVAATPRNGSDDVSIRWDGRASCDRIRISWLEKVEE